MNNIPSHHPIFTKTPNVSPANSCSSLNSYDYTNPIQYRNQQNKQFHSMFRQKNKIICNLLPDQWSFTNNNIKYAKEISRYKPNDNHQEKSK
ncbi:unnamed protein product [Schistosoma curassoni]|nr:unnamed protein product [Schistosoma curassoni]